MQPIKVLYKGLPKLKVEYNYIIEKNIWRFVIPTIIDIKSHVFNFGILIDQLRHTE